MLNGNTMDFIRKQITSHTLRGPLSIPSGLCYENICEWVASQIYKEIVQQDYPEIFDSLEKKDIYYLDKKNEIIIITSYNPDNHMCGQICETFLPLHAMLSFIYEHGNDSEVRDLWLNEISNYDTYLYDAGHKSFISLFSTFVEYVLRPEKYGVSVIDLSEGEAICSKLKAVVTDYE